MSRKYRLWPILSVAIMTFSAHAWADITEVQQLSFGKWAVTNNKAVQSITLGTNGNYTNSPSLIMIDPPTVGIYEIDGLPPFTNFPGVQVTVTQSMTGVGGAYFNVDSFSIQIPSTDGDGKTTLTLGATAKTSGNGQGYADERYEGELNIDLNL